MRFHSLQGFLATMIAGSAMVLAMVASLLTYSLEYRHSEERSEARVRALADTVYKSVQVAAFANNRQVAQDVIDGLLRNDVVSRVGVTASEGVALTGQRSGTKPSSYPVRVDISSPFDDAEKIGVLEIYPDTLTITQTAREAAISLVLWITAIIAITALVATLVIQRMVSRPVVNVVEQMKSIVPGSPARLALALHLGKNELGVLVNGFNHLLDAMSSAIREERMLRAHVEEVEKRLRRIVTTTTAALFVVDSEARLLEGNPALARVMGIDVDALEQRKGCNIFSELFATSELACEMLRSAEPGKDMSMDLELNDMLPTTSRWVRVDVMVEHVEGSFHTAQCALFDITERKLAEEAASHAALHDHLTGLANRRYYEAEIERALLHAREGPSGQTSLAILLLDLDGFKDVNDIYGHDAGDMVLSQVAQRLGASVRAGLDVVARLGGDEFAILLRGVGSHDKLAEICRKLIAAIAQPVALPDGGVCRVGASVGIACFGENGEARETLLAAADAAMYATKRRGKNGFTFASDL